MAFQSSKLVAAIILSTLGQHFAPLSHNQIVENFLSPGRGKINDANPLYSPELKIKKIIGTQMFL
jgi:hypothetical protein